MSDKRISYKTDKFFVYKFEANFNNNNYQY